MNNDSIIALTEYSYFQCIDDYYFVYVEKTNETIVLDSDLNIIINKLKSSTCTIKELNSLVKSEFSSESNSEIADFISVNIKNLVAQEVIKIIN